VNREEGKIKYKGKGPVGELWEKKSGNSLGKDWTMGGSEEGFFHKGTSERNYAKGGGGKQAGGGGWGQGVAPLGVGGPVKKKGWRF